MNDSHKMMVTKIRFVLFDAAGTLLHVRPSVAEIYLSVARRHGSRLTKEEVAARFTMSLQRRQQPGPTGEQRERQRWREIVAEVLHDISHAGELPFEELWHTFARPEQWALFNDVRDTWSELQRRGFVVGIASNFDERLASLCQCLPPLDSASHLFVSSRIGFSKPHPEFFRRIERQLSATAAEILLVGDSRFHDVDGALAAGWNAMHLERGAQLESGRTITSLRSLLSLLP